MLKLLGLAACAFAYVIIFYHEFLVSFLLLAIRKHDTFNLQEVDYSGSASDFRKFFYFEVIDPLFTFFCTFFYTHKECEVSSQNLSTKFIMKVK